MLRRMSLLALTVVFILGVAGIASAATTWDFATDYMTETSNGSYDPAVRSPWDTGYMNGTAFVANGYFQWESGHETMATWNQASSHDALGHDWKNTGDSALNLDLGYSHYTQLEPGQAGLRIGNSAKNEAAAWTAPAAGWYAVSAVFSDQDQWLTTSTQVDVYKNTTSVFTGHIGGYIGSVANGYSDGADGPTGTTRSATYNGVVQLAQNDVLTFVAADTVSMTWVGTAITVSETTAPSPEPSSMILVASGLIGLLAYAWRKRK
jgi:hypothetical protein